MGLGWHQDPSHCLSQAGEVVWDCRTQPVGTWHGNIAVEGREDCFQPNPRHFWEHLKRWGHLIRIKLQFTVGAGIFTPSKPTPNLSKSQISETMPKMLIREYDWTRS